MKNARIIPRLDIKGPNLVKGVCFEGLRVLGKPEEFARYYYEQGADELICIDVVASLYGRNSILDIIQKISDEIFIPLTVGGGLRNAEDIKAVLRSGADRVVINTAAVLNPTLIREVSDKFGSSTIMVSIEAIKNSSGRYEAYIDYGREPSGLDVLKWAKQAAKLGAGEIIVHSVEKDGTGNGFDLDLTRLISETVSIPVIASGGAGKLEDVFKILTEGKADAVSLGSVLHYYYLATREKQIDTFEEGNTEFLKEMDPLNNFKSKFELTSITKIKEFLKRKNINCRFNTFETSANEIYES